MIPVGTTHEMTWTVEPQHLASAFGSGLVDVLATPVLVGFCEEVARTMVEAGLEPGQKTVGTKVSLEHLAATPPGMTVTVRAQLTEIDRRRLCFEIDARDPVELVGRAMHERFIIDEDRFEAGIADKRARTRSAD